MIEFGGILFWGIIVFFLIAEGVINGFVKYWYRKMEEIRESFNNQLNK